MTATSEVLLFAFLFFSSFIFIGSCIFCCIFLHQINKKVKQLTILDKKFTSYLKARGKFEQNKTRVIIPEQNTCGHTTSKCVFFAVKELYSFYLELYDKEKEDQEAARDARESARALREEIRETRFRGIICKNEIDCLNGKDELSITPQKHPPFGKLFFRPRS